MVNRSREVQAFARVRAGGVMWALVLGMCVALAACGDADDDGAASSNNASTNNATTAGTNNGTTGANTTNSSTNNTTVHDAGDDASGDAGGDASNDGGGEDVGPDVPPDVPEESPPAPEGAREVPIEPSEATLERRAEYLAFCADNNGPGSGSVYGQACRVATGAETYNMEAIDEAITRMEERRDTADFRANGLVRLLYLNDATGALPEELEARIDQTLVEFKYWIDEPGEDGMAYWTENHQILFHTAELLMGQRHPDTVFPNDGKTGAEHAEHARPRILRWLDLRGRYGFSEWHSNVYFNEDIPALVNLIDFAEDPEVRLKATMVLDIIALDLLHNTFQGAFATTHGRTYPGKWINGENDSSREAAWLMVGLGEYRSAGNFGGAFLATSSYASPPLLEVLAQEVAAYSEHRQRDSFDVPEGPSIGIGYEGLDEVVVWAGASAIVAPDAIDGAMAVMDLYDLWDNFLFGDLPDELTGLVRSLVGTPQLRTLAEEITPVSVGLALEAIDTYVYRTPHYQLAGAQDYKPGHWSAQTLLWQAALDADTRVLTVCPGLLGLSDVDDVNIDDVWNGGWQPRVTLHRNVGVIQYPTLTGYSPLIAQYISREYTHAYFPRSRFDEVVEDGGWVLGRKGDGYVALWSHNPWAWAEDNDYQRIADGPENVYVVELGSADDHASFDAFVEAITSAPVSVDAEGVVRYTSPSAGAVEVGPTGPMRVDGAEVNLGPYARWEHPTTAQVRGQGWVDVTLPGNLLRLDFVGEGARTLFEVGP